MRYTTFSWQSFFKFPFCLIPSPLCFTLLSFFSKFTPSWNPLSSLLFLLWFLHSYTACGYTDTLKFCRLLLTLQNQNFTVFNILHRPKETRPHLLPPVQIYGSRSTPSPWDNGKGCYILLSSQGSLVPLGSTPLVPRSCLCISLFLSPSSSRLSWLPCYWSSRSSSP